MKKFIAKVRKDEKAKRILSMVMLVFLLIPSMVYASAGTEKLDNLVEQQIVPWVQKAGFLIAFVGGIMFAAGWRNDDADSKARGINTLISGFMIAGIATGYRVFVA